MISLNVVFLRSRFVGLGPVMSLSISLAFLLGKIFGLFLTSVVSVTSCFCRLFFLERYTSSNRSATDFTTFSEQDVVFLIVLEPNDLVQLKRPVCGFIRGISVCGGVVFVL